MRAALAAAVFAFAGATLAQVQVKEPWVRASVGQHPVTGAFMRVEGTGELVEVRSPVAGRVELHETRMDGGIARMRHVPSIKLPAELKPGGYHVMLMELKQELKAGETVPLELVVQDAQGKKQIVKVQAPVRPIHGKAPAQGGAGAHPKGH